MPAFGTPFLFSTGDVTGLMASATRPDTGGVFEIESADDFVLGSQTQINSATFTGLLVGSTPLIGQAAVEIYRVFPFDSDINRTSGAPTFSTSQVPTRVNSSSDVAFDGRDSTSGSLSFTTTTLAAAFTALNSVQPGGITPLPAGPTTDGDGAVTGTEVQFNVTSWHRSACPPTTISSCPRSRSPAERSCGCPARGHKRSRVHAVFPRSAILDP